MPAEWLLTDPTPVVFCFSRAGNAPALVGTGGRWGPGCLGGHRGRCRTAVAGPEFDLRLPLRRRAAPDHHRVVVEQQEGQHLDEDRGKDCSISEYEQRQSGKLESGRLKCWLREDSSMGWLGRTPPGSTDVWYRIPALAQSWGGSADAPQGPDHGGMQHEGGAGRSAGDEARGCSQDRTTSRSRETARRWQQDGAGWRTERSACPEQPAEQQDAGITETSAVADMGPGVTPTELECRLQRDLRQKNVGKRHRERRWPRGILVSPPPSLCRAGSSPWPTLSSRLIRPPAVYGPLAACSR